MRQTAILRARTRTNRATERFGDGDARRVPSCHRVTAVCILRADEFAAGSIHTTQGAGSLAAIADSRANAQDAKRIAEQFRLARAQRIPSADQTAALNAARANQRTRAREAAVNLQQQQALFQTRAGLLGGSQLAEQQRAAAAQQQQIGPLGAGGGFLGLPQLGNVFGGR